ncbi:divalent-cation tolerance protein CutA [Prochlorothrix hollandica]|uniref:Cation tolerance protein CutA n=1 Tax=Prochlorothrix hollandica PCC 9006 = CALU 1027 TaxID=317619 RepID=A0A0M2PWK5_PROHO|nr:divalent-cation tolerance protein CutA [Prochlorothrix hollandica]KKI99472.1 cation tolerance protein CutA [Prochlorothrix hollandica PCC 9006 = CALU 1027]
MTPDPADYGLILTTTASQESAKAIAQTLVTAKLAACVSLFPIHSLYTWQDSLEATDEWQLLIKADLRQFQAISALVQDIHPYTVPELIALPLTAAAPAYLQWLATQTTIP